MWHFFSNLFDTSAFPPRWNCGSWSAGLGWLHIISDIVTFLAYTTIPIALAIFAHKKKNLPFPGIFRWFAVFILACGTVHLIEASIFWFPWYRLSGLFKAITATVSTITVILLIPVLPKALSMKSNEEYEKQVAHRQMAEYQSKQIAIECDRVAWLNNELNLVNEQLRQRNADLDEFTHVAAHDLRAPLRAIKNLASWINDDLGDSLSTSSAMHLSMMKMRVDRMERLLTDLHLFSKSGSQNLASTQVNLDDMVDEIVTLLDVPERFRIVKIGELPILETAKIPLATVLRNLIDNSLKHHDEEYGTVTVSAIDQEDHWQLILTDDGPGIPQNLHQKVFKMFYRIKPQDDIEGSGSGLAIVDKIIKRIGGKIQISQNSPRGIIFEIDWPKNIGVLDDDSTQSTEPQPESASSPG
jgi:signal transduction histidine kinase